MRRFARWIWPSAVAACGGTVAGGLVEGDAVHHPVTAMASSGFLALLVLPFLFIASVLARALWLAWKPSEIRFVDERGAAARLAGWAATLVLGALALAWATYEATWRIASWTAFQPMSVALTEPIIAVSAALLILLVSRPCANAVAAVAGRLDARWGRRGHATLISPTRVITATALVALGIVYALWHWVVLPKLGAFDLSPLWSPVSALVTTALVHAAWQRFPRARRAAGAILVALVAGALATALYVWRAEPSLMLAIWGERPVAGVAIDELFDLDAIHDGIPLAAFAPAPRPGATHPDILLVTIDTVRADHTPSYGGHAVMPALRELGERGAVFEWAFSPSNVTRRSIPSLIIGLTPDRVRGRVVGWALRLDPRHVLLPERLRAGGYETAGFMCCEGIWGEAMHTGFARGLEHLEIEPHENGVVLAGLARAWIEQRAAHGDDRPLFLWMHLIEPHNWEQGSGPPRTDSERSRLYDRSLGVADRALGELLSAFANRPPERRPIVIVTADHGEALGEHGHPYHSTDLYDSQIHVPLVIAGPGVPRGRIAETVSLNELPATILDLAGFEPAGNRGMDELSFGALATGSRAADPDGGTAYAAMIKDRSNPGGIRVLVHGRWKLIDNGSSVELYDVHADPDERTELSRTKPQMLGPLQLLMLLHEITASSTPF